MDPPHITEFASDRYFEKLQQLNAQQQQQQQPAESSQDALNASASPSRFILPLRESKVPEVDTAKPADQKRDKSSRFFSLRHKVPLLSKPSHVESEIVIPQTRPSTESTRKRSVIRFISPRRPISNTVPAYPSTSSSKRCRTNCRFRSYLHYHSPMFSTSDSHPSLGTPSSPSTRRRLYDTISITRSPPMLFACIPSKRTPVSTSTISAAYGTVYMLLPNWPP